MSLMKSQGWSFGVPNAKDRTRKPSRAFQQIHGWVYCLRQPNDGALKIGFSRNPAVRITTIGCTGGFNPVVLGLLEGTQYDERQIHVRFDRYSLMGEWFYPHEDFDALLREPGWIVGDALLELLERLRPELYE